MTKSSRFRCMSLLVRCSKLIGFLCSVLLLPGCASEPFYESPPSLPVNVSPVQDATVVVNSDVTFIWQESANAQYYEFHIFNRLNEDTTQYRRNALSPASICSDGFCRLTLKVDLPIVRNHAWRVRAGNNAGLSEWNRNRFTTIEDETAANQIAPLQTPNPLQPQVNAGVAADSLVSFVWQAVPDATGYEFQLYNSVTRAVADTMTDMPAVTLCQSGSRCRLTRAVSLPSAKNHVWRVKAVNQAGTSPWSRSVFSVTR